MDDARRQALLRELVETQQALSMPIMPDLEIGLILRGPDGGLVMERVEPGHSWTRNAWNARLALHGQAGSWHDGVWGAGRLNARDWSWEATIGYTAWSYYRHGEHSWGAGCTGQGFNNNEASHSYGIQVGSGNTAFSPNDHKLASLIAHGTGSGQMSYAAMAQSARVYNATTKRWTATHERDFTNNSGAEILVREVGLVWGGWLFNQYLYYRCYLFARDVLSGLVHVSNGYTLTVQYRIIVDYTEIDS